MRQIGKAFTAQPTFNMLVQEAKTLRLLCLLGLAGTALFALLALLSFTALIEERSSEVVRITVTDAELLSAAQQLQGITGRIAYAEPIDGEEDVATLWRIVIDSRSEVIDNNNQLFATGYR